MATPEPPLCILDPPSYWRDQVRALLAGGGDPAALDPLLQLTGPPDVPLKGLAEDLRRARVKTSIPNFWAYSWRLRMWQCLRVEIKSTPNIPEAKWFEGDPKKDRDGNAAWDESYDELPSGKKKRRKTRTRSLPCPNCGTSVSYKEDLRGRIFARVVTPGVVRTYQRRLRAACRALELPMVTEPVHMYFRPADHAPFSTFLAWRVLTGKFEITTDPMGDVDNLIKALGDGLQGEKGTPGLLMNDRLIHLWTVGRLHPLG